MTTTRVFRSTDAGAPAITSTQGSLAALLRAVLVGTSGTAYGSLSACGWTEPFAASGNIAVFKNSTAAGGTGCYVQIDETTTNATTNSGVVKLTTYRTMSSLTAGSDPTNPYYFYRTPYGYSTGTTPTWKVVADELTFHIGVSQGFLSSGKLDFLQNVYAYCGDTISYSANDAYRYAALGTASVIVGPISQTSSIPYSVFIAGVNMLASPSNLTDLGFSLGREFTGTVAGAAPHNILAVGVNNVLIGGAGYPANPSLNGANNYAQKALFCKNSVVRGELRGLYLPLSSAGISRDPSNFYNAFNEQATVSGYLSGGTFSLFHLCQYNQGTTGVVFVESALAWGT